MANVQHFPLLRVMDNSWNGQWYDADQAPLENDFGDLDVDDLNHHFSFSPQQLNVPQNTFSVFPQEYSVATSPARIGSVSSRDFTANESGNLTGFNATYPGSSEFPPLAQSAADYSFHGSSVPRGGRKYSPSSSITSTPRASPSSVVLSQPFPTIDASLKPTAARHLDSLKRPQNEDSARAADSIPKRRRSHETTKRVVEAADESMAAGLSEDEKLLIELKEDKNMAWKEISKEFEERLQRPYQVPALQMRYKRLKERLRRWTNEDVVALEAAYEFWETNKYEIIASKMLEFGIHDKWPAKLVERKWQQVQLDKEDIPTSRPSSAIQQMPYRTVTGLLAPGDDARTLEVTDPGSSPNMIKQEI